MKAFLTLAAMALAVPAGAKTLTVAAGPDAQERLQQALLDAAPGDTVRIGAGRFDLTDGLSLDVDRVTVRGAGQARTVLSFKGQQGAGEGLLVTSDDVTLRDFGVEDAKGDGIKSKGADRVVYAHLSVRWTGGPKASNGAYGVYPVLSRDVLIDGVLVEGASDAGIYVGQCENIIVRNSTAIRNVAGIEIENSRRADVHGNLATHNTGGILIFDLPNLPRGDGGDVRIYGNRVVDNDTPNFAPAGNIVASVRMGTGVLVMANDGVWVGGNQLSGNATANVMVISYRNAYTDAKYNPLPRRVQVSGNTHGRGYQQNGAFRTLETRVLLRRASVWVARPYVWNADGTDAVLKRTGARLPVAFTDPAGAVRTISYQVPNQNQCKDCHALSGAITPIGPKVRNLNDAHQLQSWAAAGLLDRLPADAPRLARWDDASAPLADRAVAYLETNCAHCHNPAGAASNSGLFLDWRQPDRTARGLNKPPVAAGRGSGGRLVAIAPGRPDASILLYRLESTEPGVAMPELGRNVAHAEGVKLVRDWIASMPAR